ncbi:MAG TPA: ankyrin repeat domain-containing protein [Tepidisphaeraceae bacterium]|nr:ankyrin repeat domain-containing protein [Tepidisphaeraceae bacterium]
MAEIAQVCAVAMDAYERRSRLAAELAAKNDRPVRDVGLPPQAEGLVAELARRGIDLQGTDVMGYGLLALAMQEYGVNSPRARFLRLLGTTEAGVNDTLIWDALRRPRDLEKLRTVAAAASFAERSDGLTWAAAGDDVEAMELLLSLGADVNGDRRVPLAHAAARGHLRSMRWLRERGADVNRVQLYPEWEVNALEWALLDNQAPEAAKLLRSWGATARE